MHECHSAAALVREGWHCHVLPMRHVRKGSKNLLRPDGDFQWSSRHRLTLVEESAIGVEARIGAFGPERPFATAIRDAHFRTFAASASCRIVGGRQCGQSDQYELRAQLVVWAECGPSLRLRRIAGLGRQRCRPKRLSDFYTL